MKRYLLLLIAICLIVTGCGGKSDDENTSEVTHNTYNNSLTCTDSSKDETGLVYEVKLIIYYDNNDKAVSLDYYSRQRDLETTTAKVKEYEDTVCGGRDVFRKEWIQQCSYEKEGNYVKGHIYLTNTSWLDENQTKESMLNATDERFGSLKCVENK